MLLVKGVADYSVRLCAQFLCVAAASSLTINSACHAAAAVAFDSAADQAYAAGWVSATNGGYGFQPWTLYSNDPAHTGAFIGDASSNGGDNSGKPGSSGGAIN